MTSNTLLYRPCVGIALFNQKGYVFAGRRIDTPEANESPKGWQMPQGGIDPHEDIVQAAFRELKEETGTDKAEIVRIIPSPIRYDLPPDLRAKLWGGKYAGQEQTWIAMRFLGTDSDINIHADNHPEFSEWKWVPIKSLLDIIVPFKRQTYEQVVAAFQDISA